MAADAAAHEVEKLAAKQKQEAEAAEAAYAAAQKQAQNAK
jgi:hypothetical protein